MTALRLESVGYVTELVPGVLEADWYRVPVVRAELTFAGDAGRLVVRKPVEEAAAFVVGREYAAEVSP